MYKPYKEPHMTPREFFLRENLLHPPLDTVEHAIFNAPSHLEAVRALVALFRDHRVSVPEEKLGDLYLETVDTVRLRCDIAWILRKDGITLSPMKVDEFFREVQAAYLADNPNALQKAIKRHSMFPVLSVNEAADSIMERMALEDKDREGKVIDTDPTPDSADSRVDLNDLREVLMHAIYITPKDAEVMPYLFQLRKLLGDEP
jgi:hypothetical protein